MPGNFDRAMLLYRQARYEQAAQELHGVLAETPNDARSHALLGMCLMRQDKLKEAQAEADQAVGLAPDSPFTHYTRSVVLQHRRRYAEAEQAIREALQLDSANADNYSQLSVVLYQQKKWQAVLDASLEGLKFEPDHAGCNNLRTMALTELGDAQAAIATADSALARDPDDEYAHASKGWALLHERKPNEALEHFREALRLNPNFSYAQQGIIEALKARNIVYRWMLAYFLWMGRLDDSAKWLVILGGYFGMKILRNIGESNPQLQPWFLPIQIAYLVFVALTWFAVPFFNLLLRFNRFGRLALPREQRIASNWFAACCLTALVGLGLGLWTDHITAYLLAGFGMGMALPLTMIYSMDEGWPRQGMTLLATAMAVVGVATLGASFMDLSIGPNLGMLFAFGFIASPWIANALVGVTVKK